VEKTKRIMVSLLLCLSVFIAACSSKEDKWQKQLEQQLKITETKLSRLSKHIDEGNIANVGILKQYATIVKQQKPETRELVQALALDAGADGPIMKGLKVRLSDAKADIPGAVSMGDEQVNKVFQELSSIEAAAKPDTYGMLLSDPINVLADMSQGKLARVASMSKEASKRINDAEDFGVGSQLVGNPQYGHWSSQGSGGSFWQWYGQYAFFSSMFSRPISYGSWGNHRDYSYYNDYGRSMYTSPSQRSQQETVERRTREKFKRSNKTFKSPYATTKQTTAKVSRTQSKFQPKTIAKSKTRTASSKTTTSNYRSSSHQSSRSSYGGK